jgi:hypothetical protein
MDPDPDSGKGVFNACLYDRANQNVKRVPPRQQGDGLLRNSETLPPLTILCSLSRQFSERKLPQQFPWQFLGKIVWRGSEMALLGPTNQ